MKATDYLYTLLKDIWVILMCALAGVVFYFIYDTKTPRRPIWLITVIGLVTITFGSIGGYAVAEFWKIGQYTQGMVTGLLCLTLNKVFEDPRGSANFIFSVIKRAKQVKE